MLCLQSKTLIPDVGVVLLVESREHVLVRAPRPLYIASILGFPRSVDLNINRLQYGDLSLRITSNICDILTGGSRNATFNVLECKPSLVEVFRVIFRMQIRSFGPYCRSVRRLANRTNLSGMSETLVSGGP